MKLLIAGSDEVWSLERYFVKYLAEAGVDVKMIPVQSMFYRYYHGSVVHKILYQAGLSRIDRDIEDSVRKLIGEWRPDVFWVFKGMELKPGLLSWVHEQGVKLVNFNPDNPFLFSGRGSGNNNIIRSIGLYDLHFSYDGQIRERIEAEYHIPCQPLPFGFELSEAQYKESCAQEEEVKLCFLGNPDEQRASFIRELARDFPIDLYGVAWEKWISDEKASFYPPVYGIEFWKTMRRYRVQLNLMRLHNPCSHNMRSFEIPGVGGIGLFPRTPDHAGFFEDGKEVFLFNDIDECKERAARILDMGFEQADRVRILAREKSLRAGYSYRDRALQALPVLKKLTGSRT